MTDLSPNPPKLRRLRFHVWMAPEGADPATVTDEDAVYSQALILHSDQLKAELMARQRNIDMKTQPMALTSLWLYHALVRDKAVTDRYDTWRERLLSYAPVDDPTALDPDQAHPADVDPTEASTSRG